MNLDDSLKDKRVTIWFPNKSVTGTVIGYNGEFLFLNNASMSGNAEFGPPAEVAMQIDTSKAEAMAVFEKK